MAPLESGLATFQSSAQQREECSHRTHIDERKYESGLFRLQTSAEMKLCQPRTSRLARTRSPLEKQSSWLPRSPRRLKSMSVVVPLHGKQLRSTYPA